MKSFAKRGGSIFISRIKYFLIIFYSARFKNFFSLYVITTERFTLERIYDGITRTSAISDVGPSRTTKHTASRRNAMMLYALTRRCPSRWAPQRGSRSPARVPLGTTNIYLCLDYAGLPIRHGHTRTRTR